MDGRRTIAAFGLLMLVAGCDLRNPTARAPSGATPAEPAAAAPEPVPVVTPPPASAEPLALRFVTPNLGPAGGGNDVMIDGRGFDPYPRVAFGDVQAWIRSVTATEIRVTVPAPERSLASDETRIVDIRVTHLPVGSEEPVSETLVRAYSYVAEGGATPGEATSGGKSSGELATDPVDEAPEPAPPASNPAPVEVIEPPSVAPPGPTLVAYFTFEAVTDSEDCPSPSTAVRFTDRSTGGGDEWLWDFGDGSRSQAQHPEHCYSAPGMRSVSLTVSGGGSSAATSTIVITGME